MRSILFVLFLSGLCVGGYFLFLGDETTAVTPAEVSVEAPADTTNIIPTRHLETYTISDGDTFATVIETIGGSYSDALDMVDVASSTYDLTRIRLGRDIRYESKQGRVSYLEYDIDTEEKVVVEYLSTNGYQAHREDIQYDTTLVQQSATINSSLFADGNKAGMSDALILEAAEILSWSVDFATAIREGDSIRIYYEARTRNGQPGPHGKILALSFTNAGNTTNGYLFEAADGALKYYDDDGNSLIKQFLKAPLKYSRISSGYTNARFHPTQERTMPHRAIDYAAPLGTPILAVGDGVVTMAQYYGGYGNYIDIRHNSTYETQYAHLSRYAAGITPGAHVKQGDVIGYVGSTGWSTGPHLHYQIRKNGSLVNPLEVELPAGDPVPDEERGAFKKRRDELARFIRE